MSRESEGPTPRDLLCKCSLRPFCSARRGRIYLPQHELARSGLSEDDIFKGKVTEKWRNFMKDQIKRARMFFDEAEKGVAELNAASRWPVWASLLLYRQILDAIEANDYNNFTKRAYVGKVASLPMACARALAFSITFFGEWGDKSQIATIGLAADQNPYGVVLGGIIGQALCTTAAVLGGKSLASQISEKMVALSGGILFLVFGVQSFLSAVGEL